MSLRVVFFGTPAFAVPSLQAIVDSRHTLAGVVTQPDRPKGRGQRVVPGAVKQAALPLGVPILQPERLKDAAFLDAFDALSADIGVVAAYGRLLPQILLDRPRLGLINVHASLLPRWRGAAPIHRAVVAGDRETGITIMRVVLALDAGPMMARTRVAMGPDETSAALEARLAAAGGPLMVDVLNAIEAGTAMEQAQDDAIATYARRLDRHDSQIDWSGSAQAIHNQIRGLQPWPLAAAMLGGARLRLVESRVDRPDVRPVSEAAPGTIASADRDGLAVATGSGTLLVTRVQPDGRPVMAVSDFLNGRAVAAGMRFEPLLSP